jgi:glycosyltransferase 2 family protein
LDLRKNSLYIKIIAVVLTIVLLALLISQISVGAIVSTLTSIAPVFLVAAFTLYLASYFFRTLRFYFLLDKKIGFLNLFWIICAHNLFNSILPARTGEFSYILLTKSRHNVKIADGIATLVISRVFDFIAVVVIFFAVLLTQNRLPGVILQEIWMICLIFSASLCLLFILLFYGPSFLRVCTSLAGKLHLDTRKTWRYLLDKGEEVVGSLENLKGKKHLVLSMITSLLIWISVYVYLDIMMIGMHITLPTEDIILGGTFIILTTVLPIYGIAGFGTTEGVWTIVFVAMGMNLDEAILSGFSYHIITLIFVCGLGALALFALRHPPATSQDRREEV